MQTKSFRFVARLVAAAAVALGAASVGAQTMPALGSNKVTISFYNYNLASAGLGAEATKKLIQDFMAANPNITVEGVAVPSQDMTTRIQADLATGRTPDLGQLVFNDLDFMVRNFGVKALQDIVPAPEWKAHTEGMVPAGLNLAAFNGKMYGLAYTFSTPVLWMNADLLRGAGVDIAKAPATWPQVKSAALAVKKSGKEGFYGSFYSQFDWVLQGLVLSNGGRVLSKDRKQLTFGEPPAVEAVEMLRDLVDTGAHTQLSETDAMDAFRSGRLAMVLTTSAHQNSLMKAAQGKFDLRAARMPAFPGKAAVPTNSGSGLFIMAKDPQKQRAAWELMKFLTSKQGYTEITTRIGYLPLRLDIVKDPKYLGNWVAENPLILPNIEQLSLLQPWESIPGDNYKQIQKIEVQAVNEAVFGKGKVATVLQDAQKRAQALMPR
ncbi:MAG TPA: ABC transporter substrate-binding protein [Ramlibacter sp.]|nr:ABC transporter substrate-binding protein [Ramlibacter sp.]